MQTAGFAANVMDKKSFAPSDYKIRFEFTDGAVKPLTVEDANRALARRRGEDI